jgi:hypothetical protein
MSERSGDEDDDDRSCDYVCRDRTLTASSDEYADAVSRSRKQNADEDHLETIRPVAAGRLGILRRTQRTIVSASTAVMSDRQSSISGSTAR